MTKRAFRRTLSIIICAAMLVSVFAGSFTASATVTDNTAAGIYTYTWDFTDTATGESSLAELKNNSVCTPKNASGSISYSTDGYAGISRTNERALFVINTPSGYAPSKFSLLTPNNCNGGGYTNISGIGGAVIGYLTYTDETTSVIAAGMYADKAPNAKSKVSLMAGGNYGDQYYRDTLLLSDGNGNYVSTLEASAIGIDVPADRLNYITYAIELTVNGSVVTVSGTVNYTDESGVLHSADVKPIELSVDNLTYSKSTKTKESFTPAFGIAGLWSKGNLTSTDYFSKFYSVTAKYVQEGGSTETCTHANTKTIDAVNATCTADGKTAEIVCADCGAHISGGETIKALGHDWVKDTENSGNKAATCAETGLQCYKCSRCDETKSEVIAKTAHSWSDWTITKEASETEEGEKTRTCSVCNATETEKISKTSTSEYTWTFNKDADTAAKDLTDMLENSDYINNANNGNFVYNSTDKVLHINGEGDLTGNLNFRGLVFKNKTGSTGASLKPNKITVESPVVSESTINQSRISDVGIVIGKTLRTTGETRNVFVSFEPQTYLNCEAQLRICECISTFDNASVVTNTGIHLYFEKEDGTRTDKLGNVFDNFTYENFGDLTCKYVADIDDNQNVNITVTVTYTYTDSDGVAQEKSAEAETVTINLQSLQSYISKKIVDADKGNFGENITSFEPILGIVRFLSNNSATEDSKLNYVSAEYVPYKLSATAQVVLDSGIYLRINPKVEGSINTDTIKIYVDGEEKSTGTSAYNIEKYAHQMTDSMLIRLTAETTTGTACSYTINNGSYSIADNLENLYNNSDYDSFKPLIAKLANYGAAAQAYDELANNMTYSKKANEFLDETAKVTSDDAYKTFESCTASGSFYDAESDVFNSTNFKAGLSLALQGKVKMAVLVSKITISEGQTLSVKMGDETADFEYDESRGLYTAVFGTFSPKDYGETKSIQLVLKNSDGTEAATSGTAGYSVGAYINRMAQKNVTAELKTLLNALAEYQVEFAKMYNA